MSSGNSSGSQETKKTLVSSANSYFFDSLIPSFFSSNLLVEKTPKVELKWFQTAYFSYIDLGWRFLSGILFFAYSKFFKPQIVESDKPKEPAFLPEHKLWFFSSIFIPSLKICATSLKETYEEVALLIGLASQIVFFGSIYFYIKSSISTLGAHFRLIFWNDSNVFSWERFKFYGKKVGLVFLTEMTATIALSQLIRWIFPSKGNQQSENERQIQERLKGTTVFLTIISVLIFAPVFEELIYRRSMLRITNFHTSVLFSSALIFGMAHLDTNKETIFHIIPYFMGGLVFAWSYKKFRNIWISIFAHFLHNFTVLLIALAR